MKIEKPFTDEFSIGFFSDAWNRQSDEFNQWQSLSGLTLTVRMTKNENN